MEPPRANALDEDALRVWVRTLDVRCATLAGLGVISFLLPPLAGGRWLNAALVLGVIVPYSFVLCVRLRRRHRLDVFMPIADLLLAVGFGAVVPEAWPAVVAVAVADVGLAVVIFGRRVATVATVVGAAALGLAAVRVPTGGALGVVGFLVAASIVITTVGFVHAREREIRHRYSGLVNGVNGIVWEYDPVNRRITHMSPQVSSILGWTLADAMKVETWTERGHPDDGYAEQMVRAIDGESGGIEFRLRHGDGHWVWVRDSLSLQHDPSGRLRRVRGITVDASREHDSALALHQYADIVEHVQLSLVVWRLEDPDDEESLTAVRVNPAAQLLFGRSNRILVGGRLVDLWPSATGRRFLVSLARTIRNQEKATLSDVPFSRPDGSMGYLSLRMFPLPDRCAGLACDDVTDQHLAEDALRHQALHDSLTGLPNRALLQDRLANALAVAERTGSEVALLMMDLDQFKEVNDTLGHPMGDRMLEQVGARLANVLRDCDTVARLGGDEFAVLLTVDAGRSGAERVAERVRAELNEPFDLDDMSVQTAASIGIALSPEHGTDAGVLTQRADVAMYHAKRGGRGYAVYDPEGDQSSVRRLALVGELRRALERDELVLHYQPQIDMATGAVVGVEALVRWEHPEHGLLPPAEFIELAEVSGTIHPLTRWVVRTAVAQAALLADLGYPMVVAANVSGRNLYDPDLVERITHDLADFGVPPERLVLELTESELVDDPSQVMTVLSLVSDRGVSLAVDDFGTGWSSLANLTRLPVQQIKIDRSFVSRMLECRDDAVIVRSIVDLGHNLGLAVVAEGVEDEATLHALAALGCDQAQGYVICRPVPGPQLLEWLRARHPAAATGAGVRLRRSDLS